MTDAISPEEMQRRRVHVRVAISENRLEGIATSAETLAICEAYIRGEIEAGDLAPVSGVSVAGSVCRSGLVRPCC
jgi:Antitoxin VbhA